jgi:hypothetical protein
MYCLEPGGLGACLRAGQTKDYNIDMCCFSDTHVALSSEIEDWLAGNVSNSSDTSTRGLLFQ